MEGVVEFIRDKCAVWESLKEKSPVCVEERCFGGWIGEDENFFSLCCVFVLDFECCLFFVWIFLVVFMSV